MEELGIKAVYVVAIATVLTVVVRGLSQSKSLWIGCCCTLFTIGMFIGDGLSKKVDAVARQAAAHTHSGKEAQGGNQHSNASPPRPTPGDGHLDIQVTDHP